MDITNLSIYPTLNCCSALFMDNDTYVRELIFSYCRKNCRHCPLVNKGIRKMSPEMVIKQIYDAVEIAKSKQCTKVHIQLIGGDVLNVWEEFKEVCNLIYQAKWELPVFLRAVICGCSLTQEKQEWLLKNTKKVQLSYRWNENTGLEDWMNYPLLRHPMVRSIQWFVTTETISLMNEELSKLLQYGKRIQLEFFDLESWTSDNYQKFFSELGKLIIMEYHLNGSSVFQQLGLEALEQCTKRIDTIDVTGKCYCCRYLSPERMIHSTLSKYYSKTLESNICDAATEILTRRPSQKLFTEHYSVFLKNLKFLLEKSSID